MCMYMNPLLNTHCSAYVDLANFGYVIARHVNRPFSFLSLQKVVKMTWTECGNRKLDGFKIQIARISVVSRTLKCDMAQIRVVTPPKVCLS